MDSVAAYGRELQPPTPISIGRVASVKGPVVQVVLPQAAIGDLCEIPRRNRESLLAEIVAFDEERITVAPFDTTEGVAPGGEVRGTGAPFQLWVGERLLGRVIDCQGHALDLGESITSGRGELRSIRQVPPAALERPVLGEPLRTGICGVDLMTPLAVGQRLGVFASAGAGKSTLLGMFAQGADYDVVVIGLVGERGREVQEFLQETLGEAARARAVVVVATGDESAQRRAMAAYSATTVAEYFRDAGKRVLLLVDSLTRVARAIREVGLAAGEVPIRQGFTASVYAALPQLVERAGPAAVGSITGIYTVLSAPTGESDPLAEEIKSLLDGHLVLDPAVAAMGLRPAVEYVGSLSRVAHRIAPPQELSLADSLRKILGRMRRDRDLATLGGNPDPELARMLNEESALYRLLSQGINDLCGRHGGAGSYAERVGALRALVALVFPGE